MQESGTRHSTSEPAQKCDASESHATFLFLRGLTCRAAPDTLRTTFSILARMAPATRSLLEPGGRHRIRDVEHRQVVVAGTGLHPQIAGLAGARIAPDLS